MVTVTMVVGLVDQMLVERMLTTDGVVAQHTQVSLITPLTTAV
jgi:hypothetical protein